MFHTGSLVLYKQRPARVSQIADKKLSVEIADGTTISVRPKDILLLHPGPLQSISSLIPLAGEIETAWEILAEETCNLEELSELAFEEFTPSSAWAAWQLVADGLYFSGTPDEISARSAEEVAAERSVREAKAAEQKAWSAFLDRAAMGTTAPEDESYIQDVIALALGQREKSRVMKALGQGETPENAHALLLKLAIWDYNTNPYPVRAGLPTTSSAAPLGALPDEPRRDLTYLAALAIDDEGSQDPDDALSWENGRIWVHVADAAALIEPNSLADLEARARGANSYLPEGTVTMLPPPATKILALGLNDISPALSFGLDTNNEGEIIDLEIVPSWVRVTRLSYQEADLRLEESPLQQLLDVAQIYENRRQQNGAIGIDLPEVKVRMVNGEVEITPLPRLRSRDLVREAMLMTGEAVASFAIEKNIPMPFTTQQAPVGDLPEGDTPSAMFALRHLLKPSQKSGSPGKHHGLGMDRYSQATSPLRRYLDLVVHQQLRAYVRGETVMSTQDITNLIGASDSVIRDVRQVERKSNRHWTCVLLLQQPDWSGEGMVVEKRGRRHIVILPQLGMETSLYGSGDLALDSMIQLAVNDVDLVHLEASFR